MHRGIANSCGEGPSADRSKPPSEIGFAVYDRDFPGLGWTRDREFDVKIYVLVDPRDNTVRYVGQTKNPGGRRLQHRSEKSANRLMSAWKTDLSKTGQRPLFAIVDSAPEYLALQLESKWIAYYRKRGRLNNVVDPLEQRASSSLKRAQGLSKTRGRITAREKTALRRIEALSVRNVVGNTCSAGARVCKNGYDDSNARNRCATVCRVGDLDEPKLIMMLALDAKRMRPENIASVMGVPAVDVRAALSTIKRLPEVR